MAGKGHQLARKTRPQLWRTLSVREQLGKLHGLPFHVVIMKLNRMLRGWAYAYRRSVATRRMT